MFCLRKCKRGLLWKIKNYKQWSEICNKPEFYFIFQGDVIKTRNLCWLFNWFFLVSVVEFLIMDIQSNTIQRLSSQFYKELTFFLSSKGRKSSSSWQPCGWSCPSVSWTWHFCVREQGVRAGKVELNLLIAWWIKLFSQLDLACKLLCLLLEGNTWRDCRTAV